MNEIREAEWWAGRPPRSRSARTRSVGWRCAREAGFAGTPGPPCRRWARCSPPRTTWSPWSPARPPAPAAAGGDASPVAELAAEAGIPVLTPRQAPRARFPRRAARARRRLLPGRRLRRAAAAGGARRARARLGEPALLAAARLARRRAGAARDPARRRHHRRVDVPDRGGPGHRPGVRRGHRAGPARRHRGRPAGPPGRERRRLLVATLDGIEDGALVPRPQPADGVCSRRRSPSPTPRSTGPARPARRPAGPGLHPRPGAWTTFRGERLKLGPVRAVRRPRARAGRDGRDKPASRSAPARAAVELGRSSRRASDRWPPPTGRAAPASSRASALADGRRSHRPAHRPARRAADRAGRPTAPGGLRPAACRRGGRRVRQPGAAGDADRRGLSGRDAAFATELGYGTLRGGGTLDEILARASTGPARARPRGARPAAAGRVPAAAHPDPAARRRGDHRRPGAGHRQRPRRRFRQRGAAPGGQRGLGHVDRSARAGRLGRCGGIALRTPPAVDRRGFRRRARRRPRRDRGGAGRRRRPPGDPPGRLARPDRPRRARRRGRRRARPVLALRGADGRRRPRPTSPPCASTGRPCRTRAASCAPSRSTRAPLAGPRRALAGPVRRARRQGRAAGRAGGPARRAGHRERAAPAPGRARAPRGRQAVAASTSGVGDARTFERRRLRPGPARRPCSGLGALRRRPEARWRRDRPTSSISRRCRASCSPRRCGWSAPAGWWPTSTCSPHLAETAGVVAGRDLLDARAAFPGVPSSATGRPSSSGRTGTARTRCSAPCSAAEDA